MSKTALPPGTIEVLPHHPTSQETLGRGRVGDEWGGESVGVAQGVRIQVIQKMC